MDFNVSRSNVSGSVLAAGTEGVDRGSDGEFLKKKSNVFWFVVGVDEEDEDLDLGFLLFGVELAELEDLFGGIISCVN